MFRNNDHNNIGSHTVTLSGQLMVYMCGVYITDSGDLWKIKVHVPDDI